MKELNRYFLYLTCLLTGAVILILEILGFRLFAPYFGYSVYVSGSLIGLILGALSIGYYLGGRLADKIPKSKTIYLLILISAIYLTFIYLTYNLILEYFQKFGIITGTIVSTIVIFGLPMILLSMVSPFLIKLLAIEERLGSVSGTIFSISTIGSILGSFLTTFLLIPILGSNKTLFISIIILYSISIFFFLINKNSKIFPLLFLSLFLIPQYSKNDVNLIYKTESFYNDVRIYESDEIKSMMLNNPVWEHSYKPKMENLRKGYREYFNLAPYMTEVESGLILGMSAGASVRELRYFFDISIDAVEIDPVVVELAKVHFDIIPDEKLKVFTDDARSFLREAKKKYDFIEIDLFHGGPYIPFYVTTKEFFFDVHNHLTNNGLIMMNVLGNKNIEGSDILLNAIANTISQHFPSVFVLPVHVHRNSIIIATKQKIDIDAIKESVKHVDVKLKYFADDFQEKVYEFHPDKNNLIFTDDKAPIEKITYEMLKTIM